MVRLVRDETDELRGMLTLEEERLVFTENPQGGRHEFDLRSIRRARRIRGSPVLVINYRPGGDHRRIAFYFSQPPPLQRREPDARELPRPLLGLSSRAPDAASPPQGKKSAMRANVAYLSRQNVQKRDLVELWVRAIRDAIRERPA